MRKIGMILAAGALMGLILAGCEWESVTDDVSGGGSSNNNNNTNTNANNTNTNNNSNTNTNPNPPSQTNVISGTEVSVTGESLGTGQNNVTVYTGVFAHSPVKAGSVTIVAGGYVFTDNGNGTLSGSAGCSGLLIYDTGAWAIDLNGADIPGQAIWASYVYIVPK